MTSEPDRNRSCNRQADTANFRCSPPRLDWPVVVHAGKLDQTLTRDFAGTVEAREFHQQYIAAVEHHQSRSLPASAEAVRLDGPQS
jgi:hypothetical protein